MTPLFLNSLFSKIYKNNFLRFALVGFLGMITNLIVFYIFTHLLFLNINLAAIFSFLAAVSQNFCLNHFWSFKNYATGRPGIGQYSKYILINIFGLGANLFVLNIVINNFPKTEIIIAQFLGIVAGLFFNYSGSYFLVFAKNSNFSNKIRGFLSSLFNEKKIIGGILLSALFIFFVIWAGKAISVITSRAILDPVTIKIEGLNEKEIADTKVLSTLSRANNTVNLAKVPGKNNEWNNPYQTFIKKLIIGLKNEDVKKIKKITVTLGNNNFTYNHDSFLAEWKKLAASGEDYYLYDNAGNSDYALFEAPANIKANPWNVPLAGNIFSSLNFNGSEKLIKEPLVSSLKIFVFWAILIALFIIFIIYNQRQDNNITEKSEASLKKQKFITFGLTIVSAFFILFIFNILILSFYKPDTDIILKEASKIYLDNTLPAFLPKPAERIQFIFSILLSPFLLLATYHFFRKLKYSELLTTRLYSILSAIFPLLLLAAAYIGLAVSNFIYLNNGFTYSSLGKYLYGFVFFPLGALFILYPPKIISEKIIKIFVYLFSAILILANLFINVLSAASAKLITDLSVTFHLNPMHYPLAQVLTGKTLLVNLSSLYGLWPIFLEKIYALVAFNLLSFTFLMGVLLSLSYLFIFIFLNKTIKNKIILLLGFSTIIFYFWDNSSNPSPYFQYSPLRILFPALLLMLISFYAQNKNKYLYFFITLASALSILWNLDSGIIIFISWLTTLAYLELFNSDLKVIIKKIFLHLLASLLVLFLVFSIFSLYSFWRSGAWPDPSLFWQYQKMFLAGYFMIPMPFPHVWILAATAFLCGLLVAIINWLNKNYSPKNVSLFSLTIMGAGLFSYYEGRSHDLTFYGPIYTALALIAILTDIVYSDYRANKKLYGSGLLFLALLFFLLSSPINLIRNTGKYYGWVKSGLASFTDQPATMVTRNVAFIKKHTQKNESIVILSKKYYDGLFYGESQTRSAVDLPASTDVFFKREVEHLINFLKCNNGHKVFIYPFADYYFYDARVNEIIKNDYKIIAKSDDNMALLLKNKKSDNCSQP